MTLLRLGGRTFRTARLAAHVVCSSNFLFSTTTHSLASKKRSETVAVKALTAAAAIPDAHPSKRSRNKIKEVPSGAGGVAPHGAQGPSPRSKKGAAKPLPVVGGECTEKDGCPTSDETTPPFTVDILRIVEEWTATSTDALSVEGEEEGTMSENNEEAKGGGARQGDTTRGSLTSESATASAKGTATLGAAALGRRLTRAAKQPIEYPALHHLLLSSRGGQQSSSPVSPSPHQPYKGVVSVLRAAEVVRNVEHMSALVTFLRVYRTSAFFSTQIYESVMDALFRAMAVWRQQMDSAASVPISGNHRQRQDKSPSIKVTLMWLALEFRRIHFDGDSALTNVTDAAKKQKKKKVLASKGDSCEHKKWIEATKKWVLAEIAVPLANRITQEVENTELQSLSEGVVDTAVIFLTTALASGSRDHEQEVKIWQKGTDRMQTAINVYLRRIGDLNKVVKDTPSVNAQAHTLFDLLDALRLLSMADAALPSALRERVKHDAADCLLKLCSTVCACPALFTDVLCTPKMGQRVRLLPSRDLRDTVQAAIFTGAALFCERADNSAVELLLQRVKLWESGVSRCDKGYGETNENEEIGDGVLSLPRRSRRSNVAFALFSAGFEPEAVLSSGLCVGHNAMEVLEMLRTAALFSRSFALAPLPPRLSASLMAESTALIEARIRAEIRSGTSATELLEGPRSLREVLEQERQECVEEGSKDGNVDGGRDSINNGGSCSGSTGTRREDVVSLEKVLHLALATSMEFLVRGEEKRLSAQLVRLLTLLEREGSYHYLVDGLALLMDAFVERFRIAGRRQPQFGLHTSNSMSLDVERSLSEMAAMFVTRVVEVAQRQLSRAKRVSAMSDAEEQAAMQLLHKVLHFTVYVTACGMNATTAKQLVGLHAIVVKGLASGSTNAIFTSLSETVMRMNILVSHVAAKQRDVGLTRHPSSPGLRHSSNVLNDVVAAHLKPIAAAITRGGSSTAVAQERYQVLSIVSLLFRLASEYAVEAEPAELRAFRTDVLDPSLTRVLQQQNGGAGDGDEMLDLAALSEITVVMCVPHTIHHLSPQLLDQLATAVTMATPQQMRLEATEDQRRSTSKVAARLLVSAAAVAQLRQEKVTAHYLVMVKALTPFLLPSDVPAVLRAFVTFHVSADSRAVTVLRNRLAEEAASPSSCLSLQETVSALQVLCELEDVGQVAYATVLQRIIHSGHELTPGEAGVVVRIATKLQLLDDTLPIEILEFLQHLPTSLAETVLRMRQQCAPSDIPLVLQGFSQLDRERYGELQGRVMKAYILRTIQVRMLLTAKEVVECLESYTAARITHQYLFGVLLARVTDMKLKFSLPLAVRLVACGVNATWDKSVQTACLTAAQPVFLGLVRHFLQSDPESLPSVSSNALVVLQCLTQAFPNDPTSDLVLQNMASHHTALSLSTMIAVLQLIARKSSTEYNILRCMTEHATVALFPHASPRCFAELTRLFIQCGVRSRMLFDAVTKRFKEIRDECDSEALSILAEALTLAHVDLEQEIINALTERTEALVKQKGLVFQLDHCIILLRFFALIDLNYVANVTMLLLPLATTAMEREEGISEGATGQTPVEINVLLSSCIRVASPQQHTALTKRCADALMNILEAEGAEGKAQRVVGGGWQTDLMLIVQLTNNLVRLGVSDHPVMPILFELLYEKRSALMRRRLLLQTTTEAIGAAGEHTHKQLYALLVQGKLLA